MSVKVQPILTPEAQRLRQFIMWDAPSNLVPLILVPFLCLGFPGQGWLWLMEVEIVINQIILTWAWWAITRIQTDRVIIAICCSLWLTVITGMVIAPTIFPMMVLLVLWPVALALSSMSLAGIRTLMVISTVVSIIVTIIGLQKDPLGLIATSPSWIVPLSNTITVPLFTGVFFLLLWHYAKRLNSTLEETRLANAALQKSERSLEERVSQRIAEIAHKNEALQQSQRELAVARDLALEANRAKSNFLAAMSHELRTPLNAIIGYSEMLQEEAEEEGQTNSLEDLRKIQQAGKHLLTLINDILDLSKIEAGKMELYLEPFDVNELLKESASTVESLLQKQHNHLILVTNPNISLMRADLTKVRQSLLNLLSNAAKFTHEGTIELRAESFKPGWITFTVTDSGIGMNEDQLSRLFEAFTQADASTTRKYGGTGLGLAITKRFCQMMGGDITVASSLGQGSTFVIELPTLVDDLKAKTAHEEEEPAIIAEVITPTLPPIEAQADLVLVIDDDPYMPDMIKRILSKEGFRVESAHEGEEGLRRARELQPDAIILDVMMPGMDGWSVLNALKADSQLAHIPVVMATMIDDKNLGYTLGASDYLTKPIDRSQLLTVIRKYRHNLPTNLALIVEDEPDARTIMRWLLEKEGWTVQEAENGRDGLEHIVRQTPDLILLDLMMPEMDGFQLVEELHQHEQWRNIPVVIVTAKEITPEDRQRLNGWVEKVLQKGIYTREELLEIIRIRLKTSLQARNTMRLIKS